MVIATVIFWAKVVEQQVRLMRADGTAGSLAEWKALFRFLFVEPGGFQKLLPRYLSYFRPGFAPWDCDSGDVLETWQRELESSTGLYDSVQVRALPHFGVC